jgi:predicted O-methyltransferase YrrM
MLRALEYYKKFGVRDTSERAVGAVLRSTFGGILRKHLGTPSLAAFQGRSKRITPSVEALLKDLWPQSSESSLRTMAEEFEELSVELAARRERTDLRYPSEYGVESGTSFLLYSLIRLQKPSVVVESGVANGESTFLLLSALRANKQGQLHSVEISEDVGCLLSEEDKKNWHLHVTDGSKRAFTQIVSSLSPIDLFVHDSDHSYWWHYFELESVHRHLARTGIVASDDCDKSYAFLDFCEALGKKPLLLHDTCKVFGLLPPVD